MSSASSNDYRITSGPWASAWKIAAGIGVLGLAGAGAGFASDAQRFAYSYLFAFAAFLTLAIGMTFFVVIQHMVSASWSVSVRRIAEFFMSALPVFALLFLPVAASMEHLYPWTHDHGAAHATAEGAEGEHATAEHGEHAAHEHGTPVGHGEHAVAPGQRMSEEAIEHEEHGHVLHAKSAYLNKGFFFLRALIYFLVWTILSQRLFKLSTDQDRTKSLALTEQSGRMSPLATGLMALTTTFAGFDWFMSLLPGWYSTIYGVQIFAGSMVACFAVLNLVSLSFRAQGITGKAINTEHFHDLGKLLFGFNCFWAYISFSQFFLIWYASIPEETVFYHMRWGQGPWSVVSLSLVFLHFVVPFVLLMSRDVKRGANQVGILVGAVLLLTMHIVEWYWQVLPNYAMAKGISAGDSAAVSLHWMDFACLLGVGGVYLAAVFYRMAAHPVVPVGDPRLSRALSFQNA